jgi:endonuclease YncB( thermonuclease family)
MTIRKLCLASLFVVSAAISSSCCAADAIGLAPVPTGGRAFKTLVGRVAIIDGRTLWFARSAEKVRLAGVDICEVPQWAFDPQRFANSTVMKPVPCGALARAWLKRVVGDARVICRTAASARAGEYVGTCFTRGHDLAVEMLRVGWARVTSPPSAQYLRWQRQAMAARYGMWASYVLDMDEWRAKAIDRTLQRQPIADFNLLAEREREISPPFADAHNHPRRRNR